ncbi:CASP-like protein 4D1 [Mercurialis annua]|uniref:CASP-like protein 4D1 n=1 Tax=Mercurialis annua TaxID=3986 RepID=UPI00215FFC41|nr:CASP-like protein 4D1 [Mercurialis annua]
MTSPSPSPPSMSMVSRTANLILRILTFVFLIISLIILTTNTVTLVVNLVELKVQFKDIYSYRYMLATIVIGFAYTLLQIAFTLYNVITGNKVLNIGDASLLFGFYGDKVISYMLATGAAAGFASTKDLKPLFSGSGSADEFFNKGYASASLLLFAFIFTAISSVFSSYALPNKI